MKSISFKGKNRSYVRMMDDHSTLYGHMSMGTKGTVVTCWKVGFLERLAILITGKVWIGTNTYGKPLQVAAPAVNPSKLTPELDKRGEQKAGQEWPTKKG